MSEDVTPSPGGAGFQIRTHNLVGGVVIAVIGFALLGYAFYVPNTMIARFLAGATGLIGVAVAVGLLPVPNPRDFYGGLALVDLATLALIASADLPGQRGFAFGPGTAPRLFSFVLAAFGAIVALGGVFSEGAAIEKYNKEHPRRGRRQP